jgi:hypothetical protein
MTMHDHGNTLQCMAILCRLIAAHAVESRNVHWPSACRLEHRNLLCPVHLQCPRLVATASVILRPPFLANVIFMATASSFEFHVAVNIAIKLAVRFVSFGSQIRSDLLQLKTPFFRDLLCAKAVAQSPHTLTSTRYLQVWLVKA